MGLEVTCEDALTIVTYVQAWTYWASGEPDNECLVLWGLSLRWWGRIGKLVAFTGSLLVVAELVNLVDLAESFRDLRSTFKRAATKVWKLGCAIAVLLVAFLWFAVPIAMLVMNWSTVTSMQQQTMQEACTTWYPSPTCIVGAVRFQLELAWRFRGMFIVIFGPIVLVVLLGFIVGYVIPEFILRPLIVVLRTLPRWAKALNLLLIIVGFHFDLLGS